MSKLEELIQQFCPDGVEWKKLEDIAQVCRGTRVVKSQLSDSGYPVYQNCLTPMGYFDNSNCSAGSTFVICGGAAGNIDYTDVDCWAADDCEYIKCGKLVLNRYIYYCLMSNQHYLFSHVRKASIPRLSPNVIKDLEIPLPPLPVQEEIVRILDTFTELQKELQKELQIRKEQYNYYREELLTNFAPEQNVKEYKLSEISELGTGSHNTQDGLAEGLYPFYTRGIDVLYLNSYDYDETAIITAGDGAGVGKVFHFVNGKYALHQRAYRIVPIQTKVLAKYLYYYIETEFYDYIMRTSVSSSVTSIRKPMLLDFPVMLPPLTEQQRIVDILDRFDTLTNDLTAGLPAEIEARRKQYEYYRDKLLTFNKLES